MNNACSEALFHSVLSFCGSMLSRYIKKTFTIPSKYLDIYSSSKSLHAWNGRGRLRTGLFRTIMTFLTFWE